MPSVMQKDIQYYKKFGAETIQSLLTGSAPFVNAQLNVFLFSRICFNANENIDAIIADFCRAAFKAENIHLPEYYRTLEKAFAIALNISKEEALPETPGPGLLGIFDNPQTDVGDPFFATDDALKKTCSRQ